MIRVFLGNVGSGKTACAVREMKLNPSKRITYSNIKTKNIKQNITIDKSMIINKELVNVKRNGEEVFKYSFNKDFWKETVKKHGALDVVLDEAHTILNARRSGSKINVVMSDFMAMLRRILGSSASGYGELTLITQIDRRIDIIAREMATHVRYHVCHYIKECQKCGAYWNENNENPEPKWSCPRCGTGDIKKKNHIIEVWHFKNMELYDLWYNLQKKTYHKHYCIKDIEEYFPNYDTFQWDNMITED